MHIHVHNYDLPVAVRSSYLNRTVASFGNLGLNFNAIVAIFADSVTLYTDLVKQRTSI